MGGPDIMGRGWWSQTLNTLAAYKSCKYCSSLPLLASVAGNGRLVDLGGSRALVGHGHVFGGVMGSPPPGWLTLVMEGWSPVGLVCGASGSAGPLGDVELEVWPVGRQSGG
jgi:hypothetical protein